MTKQTSCSAVNLASTCSVIIVQFVQFLRGNFYARLQSSLRTWGIRFCGPFHVPFSNPLSPITNGTQNLMLYDDLNFWTGITLLSLLHQVIRCLRAFRLYEQTCSRAPLPWMSHCEGGLTEGITLTVPMRPYGVLLLVQSLEVSF